MARTAGKRVHLGLSAIAVLVVATACVGAPAAPPPVRPISSPAVRATSAAGPPSRPTPPPMATAPPPSARSPSPTATAVDTPRPASTATPTSTPAPSIPTPTPFSNPTPLAGVPPIDVQGNRLFSPRTYAEGPNEYRLGQSDWFARVPPGMRVWWEFVTVGGGGVRWGWFDAASGSLLVVNGTDLTEIERILQGAPTERAVAARNFDLLLASARRDRPE